jgi:hypothetical protein
LEIQLAEGADTPGPALGCEASASESNAVSSADDKAVNLTSADLALTGKAMAGTVNDDITQVIPKVSDGTTTLTGAAIDVTGAVRDWTATFTRAELETLADGNLTVSADYVTAAGTIGGKTITLAKDLVAPDATADTAPGEYTGPVSVALSAGAGDTITYRTDGLPNGAGDRVYTGPIALAFGTTTIAARVTDAAGNVTDRSFTYTVNQPPALAPPATPARPPVASTPSPKKLSASSLRAVKRIKVRTARRAGLRVSFLAPSGAKAAQVRLYRLAGGRKVLVKSRTLTLRGGKRHAVRFRVSRAALYATEVRVGPSFGALGPVSTIRTRVVS